MTLELGKASSAPVHNSLPSRSSNAFSDGSRSPANTTPPAVANADVGMGASRSCFHASFLPLTSNACSRPILPSETASGWSAADRIEPGAVSRLPPLPPMPMHHSVRGAYSRPVFLLNDVGGHERAPEGPGQ